MFRRACCCRLRQLTDPIAPKNIVGATSPPPEFSGLKDPQAGIFGPRAEDILLSCREVERRQPGNDVCIFLIFDAPMIVCRLNQSEPNLSYFALDLLSCRISIFVILAPNSLTPVLIDREIALHIINSESFCIDSWELHVVICYRKIEGRLLTLNRTDNLIEFFFAKRPQESLRDLFKPMTRYQFSLELFQRFR